MVIVPQQQGATRPKSAAECPVKSVVPQTCDARGWCQPQPGPPHFPFVAAQSHSSVRGTSPVLSRVSYGNSVFIPVTRPPGQQPQHLTVSAPPLRPGRGCTVLSRHATSEESATAFNLWKCGGAHKTSWRTAAPSDPRALAVRTKGATGPAFLPTCQPGGGEGHRVGAHSFILGWGADTSTCRSGAD